MCCLSKKYCRTYYHYYYYLLQITEDRESTTLHHGEYCNIYEVIWLQHVSIGNETQEVALFFHPSFCVFYFIPEMILVIIIIIIIICKTWGIELKLFTK